jgi:hypothetical protein
VSSLKNIYNNIIENIINEYTTTKDDGGRGTFLKKVKQKKKKKIKKNKRT